MLKIISGGQLGIDRMGLEIAKELGFEAVGTAPKYFLDRKWIRSFAEGLPPDRKR